MLALGPRVMARSISLLWSQGGFISGSPSMGGPQWFLLSVGAGQHAARVRGAERREEEESAPNHFILHPKKGCGSLLAPVAAFNLLHVQRIPPSLPLGTGRCPSPGAPRGDKVPPPCASHCPASGQSTALPQLHVSGTPMALVSP